MNVTKNNNASTVSRNWLDFRLCRPGLLKRATVCFAIYTVGVAYTHDGKYFREDTAPTIKHAWQQAQNTACAAIYPDLLNATNKTPGNCIGDIRKAMLEKWSDLNKPPKPIH